MWLRMFNNWKCQYRVVNPFRIKHWNTHCFNHHYETYGLLSVKCFSFAWETYNLLFIFLWRVKSSREAFLQSNLREIHTCRHKVLVWVEILFRLVTLTNQSKTGTVSQFGYPKSSDSIFGYPNSFDSFSDIRNHPNFVSDIRIHPTLFSDVRNHLSLEDTIFIHKGAKAIQRWFISCLNKWTKSTNALSSGKQKCIVN